MNALGWFLLNTAQAMFLGFWSVVWISIAGFFSIFSRELPLVLARHAWAPGLIRASLAKVVAENAPKLDPRSGYVFVMNHQSMYDIAVAFAVIPRNLRFVAKRVLLFVPFLGFYLWRTGMVLVDRKKTRDAYSRLGRAAEQLKSGDCFLAYPEGTRSMDGKIHAFKRGAFVTAIQAGAPVVPVAIEGSGQVLPRGGFNLRPDVVRVAIGAPIPTTGLTEADVPALIRRARSEMIALHRALGGLGGDEECLASISTENSGEDSIEEMPWQEARP
jgi:1-acyl-sn-glycerol-3-phosphate acyltransferase